MQCQAWIHPASSAFVRCLIAAAAMAALASSSAAQSPLYVSVTIYNNDRASVREVRRFQFHTGQNQLSLHDVPSLLDPTSVVFRPLGSAAGMVAIIEQNFDRPISDDLELLFKRLGDKVGIRTRANRVISGVLAAGPFRFTDLDCMGRPLISYDWRFLTLLLDGRRKRLLVLPLEEVERVEIPRAEKATYLEPRLRWLVQSAAAGAEDVEIMYQTSGMSWEADYQLILNMDRRTAALQAQITIENRSGRSYRQARLKLVAGDVQLFEDEFGRQYSERDLDLMQEGMKTEETAGVPTFVERGFSGYHLYALDRAIDLGDQETKQTPFLDIPRITVDRYYVYDGNLLRALDPILTREMPDISTSDVCEYAAFKNEKARGMGIPLPKGRVRILSSGTAGAESRSGDQVLEHTAAGEEVMLKLGVDPDLSGDRRTMSRTWPATDVVRESIQIRLNSRKDHPVEVRVVEHPERAGDWVTVASSDPYEKKSSTELEFRVMVTPGDAKLLSYTIEHRAPAWDPRRR